MVNINSILIDPNSKRSNVRIIDRYHGFETVKIPKMIFNPNHESYNHKIVAEVDQNENVRPFLFLTWKRLEQSQDGGGSFTGSKESRTDSNLVLWKIFQSPFLINCEAKMTYNETQQQNCLVWEWVQKLNNRKYPNVSIQVFTTKSEDFWLVVTVFTCHRK